MKEQSGISDRIKANIRTEAPEGTKKISYSQFNVFQQCQYRWYLQYAQKLYPFNASIDTVFGTAIHETLQRYLVLLFNESVKASEDFKMLSFFKERLIENYNIEFIKNEENDFTDPDHMKEYYEDGVAILEWVKAHRKRLFDTKKYELVGIEIPIMTPVVSGMDKIYFQGFIDVVLRNRESGMIFIIDIKTSRQGWKDYQKKDQKKIAQVLLYKRYFSEQYGISEDDIEVTFFIVKRKLYEHADYHQDRVQHFDPANGRPAVNEAVKNISEFLHECFYYDGQIIEKEYKKNPGKSQYNCKYCPFNDDNNLCNKKP